jgi:hypothetical protein
MSLVGLTLVPVQAHLDRWDAAPALILTKLNLVLRFSMFLIKYSQVTGFCRPIKKITQRQKPKPPLYKIRQIHHPACCTAVGRHKVRIPPGVRSLEKLT